MLLVFIGVGGFLYHISSSACCDGMYSSQFIYRAPSLTSADEGIIASIICAIVSMAPLFGGSGGSLDMKILPPGILIEFVSSGWGVLQCTARMMSLDQ